MPLLQKRLQRPLRNRHARRRKPAKLLEKAALAEENNAKEAQYRREAPDVGVDADGRIKRSTDEEWQKQRAQRPRMTNCARYFQQNRPWIEDAEGSIIPRQTDEEWRAAQNEKA